jgi:hypothetical protein
MNRSSMFRSSLTRGLGQPSPYSRSAPADTGKKRRHHKITTHRVTHHIVPFEHPLFKKPASGQDDAMAVAYLNRIRNTPLTKEADLLYAVAEANLGRAQVLNQNTTSDKPAPKTHRSRGKRLQAVVDALDSGRPIKRLPGFLKSAIGKAGSHALPSLETLNAALSDISRSKGKEAKDTAIEILVAKLPLRREVKLALIKTMSPHKQEKTIDSEMKRQVALGHPRQGFALLSEAASAGLSTLDAPRHFLAHVNALGGATAAKLHRLSSSQKASLATSILTSPSLSENPDYELRTHVHDALLFLARVEPDDKKLEQLISKTMGQIPTSVMLTGISDAMDFPEEFGQLMRAEGDAAIRHAIAPTGNSQHPVQATILGLKLCQSIPLLVRIS